MAITTMSTLTEAAPNGTAVAWTGRKGTLSFNAGTWKAATNFDNVTVFLEYRAIATTGNWTRIAKAVEIDEVIPIDIGEGELRTVVVGADASTSIIPYLAPYV